MATPAADDRPWAVQGGEPKPLVPVATRPVLFHALDLLRRAGVLEVVLITEPAAAPVFRAAVGDGDRWGMTIAYAQAAGGGDLGRALTTGNGSAAGEPLLVQRADALLHDELREDIVTFAREGLDALALRLAGDLGSDGVAEDACYLLSARAVDALRALGPIEDPIAGLRRHGTNLQVSEVDGCLACQGGELSLLRANRHALERLHRDVDRAHLSGCEIQGHVVVHPTAVVKRTLVRGPAIVGPGARIVDSYIGPYTSIGANACVEGTEIEHSIVMDTARLLYVGARLETSIIGRGATIARRFDMPKAVRLSVGDRAEVALS